MNIFQGILVIRRTMEGHDKEDDSNDNVLEERMGGVLERKRREGSYRRMVTVPNIEVDFSSNDYLGLSRCPNQKRMVKDSIDEGATGLGATGSRLLSGQSRQYEEL